MNRRGPILGEDRSGGGGGEDLVDRVDALEQTVVELSGKQEKMLQSILDEVRDFKRELRGLKQQMQDVDSKQHKTERAVQGLSGTIYDTASNLTAKPYARLPLAGRSGGPRDGGGPGGGPWDGGPRDANNNASSARYTPYPVSRPTGPTPRGPPKSRPILPE